MLSRQFFPTLLLLLLIYLSPNGILHAQSAASKILKQYYALNFDYFQDETAAEKEASLYRALQSRIEGDETDYINHLEDCLTQADSTTKQILAQWLFDAYTESGAWEKAKLLNEEAQLGQDMKGHTDYAFQDKPRSTVEMDVAQTSVPFNRFYCKVVVGTGDTLKLFLDTGAPGIAVDPDVVDRYDWLVDTNYSSISKLPSFGITVKNHAVLIPELHFGDAHFYNLRAKFGRLTDEQKARMKNAGVEDFDILMGINDFMRLIDGVAFDYAEGALILYKELPERDVQANFMMVQGKPVVSVRLKEEAVGAHIDTGSPRHVFTKEDLEPVEMLGERTGTFGKFEYPIYTLEATKILNKSNLKIEAANYGYPLFKNFKVRAFLGSFMGQQLFLDFKNRVAELR